MAGTDAAAIISEASAMVDAYLGDFSLSPPLPVTDGGTVFDYYIRRCTSHLAVWLAAESLYRSQYEVGAEAWWDRHRTDAEGIFEGLRSGKHQQGRAVSVWERGIGPAVAQGTAPDAGLVSNCYITGDYYLDDTIARTIIVELDGSGTDIYGQTYKWQYKGGSAWEQTTQTITPGEWSWLAYGVAITADTRYTGTVLASGMKWEIECNPSRARNYKGVGLVTWSRKR
jgi:hypothetical protein